jgi:23S rRNA (uracil1939-C5)-methyltransferase
VELTIEKLVYGGDGLARLESGEDRAKTIFVPFVLPGERVEATVVEERPGFGRARLEGVLQSSEERTQAACPYFGSCGGCQYQHIEYDAQVRFKSEILRETLRRTAKLDLAIEVQAHPSPPLHYRNRTRFHIRHNPEFAIGYFRQGSHQLLPVRECPISSSLINRILRSLWELGEAGVVPKEIAEIELFADAADEKLLVEVYLRQQPSDGNSLSEFARNFSSAFPAIEGIVSFRPKPSRFRQVEYGSGDVLWGKKDLHYEVGGERYVVSAGAFFQTNRFLLPHTVELVTGNHKGRLALDLYSGVGLFAVLQAKRFERVVAVESSPVSAADLRVNVAANVKISSQSTEAYLASVAGKLKPDLIVADPPRTGLGAAVCAQLNRLPALRMTYLSCDPATLARDLKELMSSGWRISEMHLVDLFPQTFHIETCVMLQR